jgi:hypothetical protein
MAGRRICTSFHSTSMMHTAYGTPFSISNTNHPPTTIARSSQASCCPIRDADQIIIAHVHPAKRMAMVNSSTSPTYNYDEVRWTDDSIRWKGGLRVKTSSVDDNEQEVKTSTAQDESDDEEEYVIDPFKLSDDCVLHLIFMFSANTMLN